MRLESYAFRELSTCYLHVRPEFSRSLGVLHLASAFGVCLGAAETIPKVCPIRVLVLLGIVRPCSLPPVRILSCKTQKKKKKKKKKKAAPPRSTDLFLADDRRTWTPAPALLPLWQRLRLAMAGQPACSPPRWTCTSHSSADGQGSGSQDHGAAARRHAARLDTCGWEACAGQGACAQHGIGDGTRSSQGRPTWSAGATAACCAP